MVSRAGRRFAISAWITCVALGTELARALTGSAIPASGTNRPSNLFIRTVPFARRAECKPQPIGTSGALHVRVATGYRPVPGAPSGRAGAGAVSYTHLTL